MVMNIISELDFCKNLNAKIAQDYFYFSFLTRDYPLPDRLSPEPPRAFLVLFYTGFRIRLFGMMPPRSKRIRQPAQRRRRQLRCARAFALDTA